MNQDFVTKFMKIYSDYLFPNEEKTPEEIANEILKSEITDLKFFSEFPFANPEIAKKFAFFGLEIFYVWDKYILKMYVLKVIICLLGVLPMIIIGEGVLTVLCAFLMIPALLIIQKIIRKKIPEISRKYNCDIFMKALNDPESIKIRKIYLKIIGIIVFVLKDKKVRKAWKDLSDSFDIY